MDEVVVSGIAMVEYTLRQSGGGDETVEASVEVSNALAGAGS